MGSRVEGPSPRPPEWIVTLENAFKARLEKLFSLRRPGDRQTLGAGMDWGPKGLRPGVKFPERVGGSRLGMGEKPGRREEVAPRDQGQLT